MIPYKEILRKSNRTCHFIHANGYPPDSYMTLLEKISKQFNVKSVLLRPHWDNKIDIEKINDWNIFYNDIRKYNQENNVFNSFGLGHSIGGNILLKTALNNHKYYSAIVLLDPTIFSPVLIYLWRLFRYVGATCVNPMIKKAKSRRIEFISMDEVFGSYRSKNIFSRVNDKELKDYIESIFVINDNSIQLSYDTHFEAKMYETAGQKDMDIWKNLDNLKVPTLIIIPENNPVFKSTRYYRILKNKYIEILEIKNTTHLFPLEKPYKTSDYITSFFNRFSL